MLHLNRSELRSIMRSKYISVVVVIETSTQEKNATLTASPQSSPPLDK